MHNGGAAISASDHAHSWAEQAEHLSIIGLQHTNPSGLPAYSLNVVEGNPTSGVSRCGTVCQWVQSRRCQGVLSTGPLRHLQRCSYVITRAQLHLLCLHDPPHPNAGGSQYMTGLNVSRIMAISEAAILSRWWLAGHSRWSLCWKASTTG